MEWKEKYTVIGDALLMSPDLAKEVGFCGWTQDYISRKVQKFLKTHQGWIGSYEGFRSLEEWEAKIRRHELEKRVGTRVREGDLLPAGTEFDYKGEGRRLEWLDGKSHMWNTFTNARYIPDIVIDAPDSHSINISKFTHCEYRDYIITKIGPGAESPEKEEALEKQAPRLAENDVDSMVIAVQYTGLDVESWKSGNSLPSGVKSLKPGIAYLYIIGPEGSCSFPTGKSMIGGALFKDGHVEVRGFIGGECPFFEYLPKSKEPEWPKGYGGYGAFVFQGDSFVRGELTNLLHYCYDESKKGPAGYFKISQEDTASCDVLSQLPAYIKTKNFDASAKVNED